MLSKDRISANALSVISTIQSAGFEAYLVGGAVRDILLDITPKDYDLATSATPEEIAPLFRFCKIIGRRFRLAHVHKGRDIFEVSTFRRMPTIEERRGRNTNSGVIIWRDNCFGTLADDVYRRDFTVNALYHDPFNPDHPTIDHVGGINDLFNGVVRTIGDPETRLLEDPVRMVRACKLVGQYGFTIEPKLARAIREHAVQLHQSSVARLLEELFKILKRPYTFATLASAYQNHVLHYFLPALAEHWQSDAGRQAQQLLQVRDRLMKNGEIFPSRATGLAVLVLPFLKEALSKESENNDHPLWRNFTGIEKFISHYIREFIKPHHLPRYLVATIRNTLLLQPKFLSGISHKRLNRHSEFNRGRDVFRVYAATYPTSEHKPLPSVNAAAE